MTAGAAVVGGASGLGEAVARALYASGMRVTVVDRDAEGARAVASALGPRAASAVADVTHDEQVGAALDAAAVHGPLRAVVCCAGIGWAERLAGRRGVHAAESFANVIAVNLQGSFHVLRHAARVMTAGAPEPDGQRGVCVLTASIAAQDGQAGQIAYAASKAGVAGMALPAARDLAPAGIRVCAIAPGTFDTPLLAGLPQPAREQLARQVPWPPRLGRAEEFGSLVLEVVRNRMLNGEVLRLDGALRMGFESRRDA
jgi:3-hydroxyacyl-CoA dehydrogenase / 3-hydroxy-2-methylbutyryl-CoA dehydrogenase